MQLKLCRMVRAIYQSASVRIAGNRGHRGYSRNIAVHRGVIQGDIPSPVCFLVALDNLLKEHVGRNTGISLTPDLALSDLEYTDGAALTNEDVASASDRVSQLEAAAKRIVGMSISVPMTKVQHVRPKPRVLATTEADVSNLPPGSPSSSVVASVE